MTPEHRQVAASPRDPAAPHRTAIIGLWASTAAIGVTIVASLAAAALIALAPALDLSTAGAYDVAVLAQLAPLAVAVVVWLVAMVLWLIWFAEALRRLPALGITTPRRSVGWSVTSWFIPIASLFVPKQATNDLWRSGDLDARPGDPAWYRRPVPSLLTWWWVAYLAYWVPSSAILGWEPAADAAAAELIAYFVVIAIAWAPALAVALLSIRVTLDIEARQRARAAQLAAWTPAPWSGA